MFLNFQYTTFNILPNNKYINKNFKLMKITEQRIKHNYSGHEEESYKRTIRSLEERDYAE